jgi:hypothetical protein
MSHSKIQTHYYCSFLDFDYNYHLAASADWSRSFIWFGCSYLTYGSICCLFKALRSA